MKRFPCPLALAGAIALTVTVRDGRIARGAQEYDLHDPQTAGLCAAVGLATRSPAAK